MTSAQSLDTLKTNSLRFFSDYINRYVIEDLKVLEKIEPDADGLGACAVPTAMTVISTMDLLVFYWLATAFRAIRQTISLSIFIIMSRQ